MFNLRRVFLFLLFTTLSLQVLADARLDSLKQVLLSNKNPLNQMGQYALIGEHYFQLSQADSALYYTLKGIEVSHQIDSAKIDSVYFSHMTALLNNAAFISQKQGKIYEAIQLYNRSIFHFKAIQDSIGIGAVYLNLGRLYVEIKEYDIALQYLNKALKSSIYDEFLMAKVQTLIGKVYVAKGKQEAGLNQFYSALATSIHLKENSSAAEACNQIGLIYQKRKDYEQAKENFQRAINFFTVENQKRGLAETTYYMACLMQMTNNDSAFYYANQSYAYAIEVKLPANLRDAASILSQLYQSKGDYKSALDMRLLFDQMDDSLSSQEAAKMGAREQLRMDMEAETLAEKLAREKDQETLKRQRIIIYSCLAGGLLLLALLLIAVRSYRLKRRSNIEISEQKKIVEEQNKEIMDSIQYAERIQQAMLPSSTNFKDVFPESFIFFRPRNIVSGDFYWMANTETGNYLAVCDSTGHGVPGAFVSLLNMSFLNEAVSEKKISEPGIAFDFVRTRLNERMGQNESQDGMDAVLIGFDKEKPFQMNYAAANNKPIVIRKKELIELAADKMPVGKSPRDKQTFSTNSIALESGDLIIIYTDGYADQFGGLKGKKFRYKALNELLIKHAEKPLSEISKALEQEFDQWKGHLEQVDDVLIVGFRMS
jgi:serine phosphatase RsbU (regulator of sigma subunit)